MRLFIALNLDSFKDYFEALQQEIYEKEIKFTFPKSFHLTLKFLGDIPEKDIARIEEFLTTIKFKPYQVTVGSIGVFPNEQYIRTIWVELEGEETIALQKRIEETLQGIGKKTKGTFKAHITLARVKHIDLDRKEGFIEKLHQIKTRRFQAGVDKFYLIKSTLTPEGPVYEVLKEYH